MHLPEHITYRYQRIEDVDLRLASDVLSASESRYLDSVKHDGRRVEFTAGRVLARHHAGEVLGQPPHDVPLQVADDGSLFLADTSFSISLAHSRKGVCVATSRGSSIGVDLEIIKPRHPDLYRFILHPDEYPMLDTLHLNRDRLLILCWALKEATLKGMKTGFRCSPKKLILDIDTEHNRANIVVEGNDHWKGFFKEVDGSYLALAFRD